MADLTVVVDGSDAGIRSMMDRLKADIRSKSAEISRDFSAAFKNADTDATAALAKINAAYDKARSAAGATVADIVKAQQKWSADTARLSSDIKAAQDAAAASAGGLASKLATVTGAAQGAGVSTGLFGQIVGALTSPLGLASVAVGALTLGYHRATQAVIQNAAQVKELMAVSGLSAEAADNLADTFQILGRDTGSLTTALFRMSGEIDSGGEAFRNLGVNVRDARGQLKAEGDLFLEVRDRISDISSASQRASIAQDIFGRGARQLAGVFAMSRAEYQKWSETAAAISPWGQAQQDAVKEYTRNINQLSMQWDAFWLAVGTPLISTGAAVLKWINAMIVGARALASSLGDAWKLIATDAEIAAAEVANAAAAAEKAFDRARAAGERLPEEGVPLAGQRAFDATSLPKAAREQLRQLELQLKQIQATEAEKPVLALTQALEEFRLKYGEAAAEFAKGQIFDKLIDEAKIKGALIAIDLAQSKISGALALGETTAAGYAAKLRELIEQTARYARGNEEAEKKLLALRQTLAAFEFAEAQKAMERWVQSVTDASTRATNLIKESAAARGISEEEAARRTAQEQIDLTTQVAAAAVAAAKAAETQTGVSEENKRALTEKARAATMAMENAVSAGIVLLRGQETASLKTQLEIESTLRQGAQARTLAGMESEAARASQLAALAGDDATTAANNVYRIQVELAGRRQALLESGFAAEQATNERRFGQNLISLNDYLKASTDVDEKRKASRQKTDDDILAADVALFKALALIAQQERDREEQLDRDWAKTRAAIMDDTAVEQVETIKQQIRDIEAVLREGVRNEAQRQQLLTNIYALEGQKRVLEAETDAQRRLDAQVKEMDGYARLRQRDVDNRVRVNVEIMSGVNRLAADELAVAAGTVEGILRERQKLIDNLEVMNRAQESFFQQGLDGWAAGARAAGDMASFVDAQFAIALTRGRDTWSLMTDLVHGTVDDMRTAFGGFFTDFASNLQKGLGFWESFTDALSSLWHSVLNSMVKRFSDFLVDVAFRALGSGGLGDIFGALIGGGATAAAGAIGGGASIGGAAGAIGGEAAIGGGASVGGLGGVAGLAASGVSVAGFASKLVGMWESIDLAGTAFVFALQEGASVIGAVKYAFDTLPKLGPGFAVIGGAATAIGVALTAMRDDITDVGKGIQTSLQAASYALITFGEFWGKLVGVALLAISFILEFTGIFEKASEDWLSFGTRLAGTLGREQDQLTIFGDELSKATDLTGIAKSIEQFRHNIEDFAGVGGFFAATAGRGLFNVPGIPGATGTEHEGGILFDFAPFIKQIQDAVDEALDSVRDTISVKFADAARAALPDDVATAFVEGVIGNLRQSFEDLVNDPNATLEDIEEFEKKMKAVGDLLVTFASEAKIISEIGALARDVLPPNLFDAVTASAASLKADLIELAASGTATADQLAALGERIKALGQGVALYNQLTAAIGALAGDVAQSTQQMIAAVRIQLSAAARSVEDARNALAHATTTEAAIAAETALTEAVMNRYELERQLVLQIEQTLRDLLNDFGSRAVAHAMTGINAELERGSTGRLTGFVSAMEAVATSSASATVRLWAATTALQAIIGAVPAAIRGIGGTFADPTLGGGLVNGSPLPGVAGINAAGVVSNISQGILAAALPSFGTIGNLIDQALGAGDLQQALTLLGQGGDLVQALGESMIDAVNQWRDQALAALQAQTEAQVEAVRKSTAAQVEANNVQIDAQRTLRATVEKTLETTRELSRAVESMGNFIRGLRLGTQAPPDPIGQLQLAQTYYSQALAAFNAAPSASGLGKVQESASQLLAAAQNVYTRPSPEYRSLFDGVVGQLEAVKATAEALITPEEQAQQSLDSIDAEIKRLTDLNATIQKDGATQIKALQDNADRIAAEITAAAKTETDNITKGLGDVMTAIAIGEAAILGQLVAQQEAVRSAVTGGLETQVFLAARASQELAELSAIRSALETTLLGSTQTPALPGPPPIEGSHREGLDFVPRDNYVASLHRGEGVLTAEENAARGAFAGATFVFNIPPGTENPERVARVFRREFEGVARKVVHEYMTTGKGSKASRKLRGAK